MVHGALPVMFSVMVAVPPEQMVLLPFTVAFASGVTVSRSVAMESQPELAVRVTE